jgi:hypothetical protein
MRRMRWTLLAGLAILCGAVLVVPAMAAASSISGTVTAEGGGPLQGVRVCPTPQPWLFEADCDETDAVGHYELVDLPAAEYRIGFSGASNNLRYVDEFYEDTTDFQEADLIDLEEGENATVDAALAEGGSIAGIVTDETTGLPIAGLFACANDPQSSAGRCAKSNGNGEYIINGLPGSEYIVEFEGFNEVNYLREVYDDVGGWGFATKVTVTGTATTSGVDAELARGAEILGHVSNVATGAPAPGAMVCAMESGEQQNCDWADSAGNYAIRGLPAGAYLIAFEFEPTFWGNRADEWWQGAESEAEAAPIVIAPPESRSGIDGRVGWLYTPPQEPETGGTATASSPPPTAKKPPRKCKKGFHRKLVKGKQRCVRKHKKHQQRRKGGKAGKARR